MMPDTGPVVTGGCVILSGAWLDVTRQAVEITARTRNRNGLPATAAHTALAAAIASAMAASGQTDMPKTALLQYVSTGPTVTVQAAANQLGLSMRQTRRLAPTLGGRRIGGRWLLDQAAIDEHTKGK